MLSQIEEQRQINDIAGDIYTEFESLVKKAASGDKKALCELCEEIARGVLFQMTYILGDKINAEDISQEVLIRVCENIQGLRNPKAFKGWLARIIVNEKNRYLAKHLKQGPVLNIEDQIDGQIEEQEDNAFVPHRYVEDEEMSEAVMKIIASLPMRQREAIILHYYNDLSITEVAKAMGITTQSVSINIKLAREKLKKMFESHDIIEYRSMPAGSAGAGVSAEPT